MSATISGPRPGQASASAEPDRLPVPLTDCMTMIYPTPIVVHQWPDSAALNAELLALVAADEKASPISAERSNVGGWHSDTRFFERDVPCVRVLLGRIRIMSIELTRALMAPGNYGFRVEGWANVLRSGQYNSVHVHPNSTWSGVYYVNGNPVEPGTANPFSGKIELIDPRPGASASYTTENILQRRFLYSPTAGAMLVFPSWLQHMVHPYFGAEARVCIAFNVTVGAG